MSVSIIADGLKLQMHDTGGDDHPGYFPATGGDHKESMSGITDGSHLAMPCSWVGEAYAR